MTIEHINLNDKVYARLTARGEERLRDNYRKLNFDGDLESFHPVQQDGTREFQLWELMQHFGDLMFNGNNLVTPFESSVMRYKRMR